MLTKIMAPDKVRVKPALVPKAAELLVADHLTVSPMQLHYDCPCGGGCPKCMSAPLQEQSRDKKKYFENQADQMATQLLQDKHSSLVENMGQKVLLHNDASAHQAAEQMHARAFTMGNHIYFNQGEYNPQTYSGRHLIAHEMTHAYQQSKQKAPVVQKKDQQEKEEKSPNVTTLIPWPVGTSVFLDMLVDTFSGKVTARDETNDRMGMSIALPVKMELALNTDKATGTQRVSMTPYLEVNKQYLKLPVLAGALPDITLSTGADGEVMINGFYVKKNPRGLELIKKVNLPWSKKPKELNVGTVEGMSSLSAGQQSGFLKPPRGGFTSLGELLPFIMGSQVKLSTLLTGEQTFTIGPGKAAQGLALAGTLPLNLVLKGAPYDIKMDVLFNTMPIKENISLPITQTDKGITFTLPGFNKTVELVPGSKALKVFAGPLQVGALSPVKNTFPGTAPWVPRPVIPSLYTPPYPRGAAGIPLGGLRLEVDNMFLMRALMTDLTSPNSTILSLLPGTDWKKGLRESGRQLDKVGKTFETDMTALVLNGIKRYLAIKYGFQTDASSDGKRAWLTPSLGVSGNLPFKQLKLFFYAGAGLPVGLHNIGEKTHDVLNLGFYTDVAVAGTEDEWSTALRFQAGTGSAPTAGFLMFNLAFDESKWFQ